MTVRTLGVACACLAISAVSRGHAQTPVHFAIVPMANLSKPADLDFEGGACEIDRTRARMTCEFQQLLLTPVPDDPTTCLITTNVYEQTFRQVDGQHWTASEGPAGACGVMTVTTLEQQERSLPALWRVALTSRKTATKPVRDPAVCGDIADTAETMMSTEVRRPLACRFVKASSLGF